MATGGGHLVYLEIGDGTVTEVKHAQLEYEVSCLDMNPIGENPNYSQLAAVGMWTDISVIIFSIPDLNRVTKENLGGEIIPRSVLLCSFEGVCPRVKFLDFSVSCFLIISLCVYFVSSRECKTFYYRFCILYQLQIMIRHISWNWSFS